jgi:hypothetical protein
MVRAMVLMRGVQCGTLYKLLGSTYTNGCNSFFVPEQRNKEDNVGVTSHTPRIYFS